MSKVWDLSDTSHHWEIEDQLKGMLEGSYRAYNGVYPDSVEDVTINSDDLTYGYGYGSGSFELYPTKNMYQFILIDKTSGKKWHVQWGMESSKRWIRRIY